MYSKYRTKQNFLLRLSLPSVVLLRPPYYMASSLRQDRFLWGRHFGQFLCIIFTDRRSSKCSLSMQRLSQCRPPCCSLTTTFLPGRSFVQLPLIPLNYSYIFTSLSYDTSWWLRTHLPFSFPLPHPKEEKKNILRTNERRKLCVHPILT